MSVGMGGKAVEAAVARVQREILPLEFEKLALLIAEETALNGGDNVFGFPLNLRGATRQESSKSTQIHLRGQRRPFEFDRTFETSDRLVDLLQPVRLAVLRGPQRDELALGELAGKDQPISVEPLDDGLFDLLGRTQDLLPSRVFLGKPRANLVHLLFVTSVCRPRRAASDVAPVGRPWAERDMRVKVSRVVMEPIGETNRISGMKFFPEPAHDFFIVEWSTWSGLSPAATSASC
jgi:hypothetical protein